MLLVGRQLLPVLLVIVVAVVVVVVMVVSHDSCGWMLVAATISVPLSLHSSSALLAGLIGLD